MRGQYGAERMSNAGPVRSGETAVLYTSATILSPPRAKACGSEFLFASCPVGKMMTSIGEDVGFTSTSKDGSAPLVERISKSTSSKELWPEIIISENDVRNYNNMLWLKDEYGEAWRMWDNGKEMSFTLLGEKEVVLNRFRCLENRDDKSIQMKNHVSDDDSN